MLWYVTNHHRDGMKAVVACSRLEEIVVDDPHTLHRRFRHLGVWHQQQASTALATVGTALRFVDTEVFPRQVAFDRLEGACGMVQAPARAARAPQDHQRSLRRRLPRRPVHTVNDHERALVLSLRPRFADSILDGRKSVELRRQRVSPSLGTPVLLYASAPVMAVVGTARVAEVHVDEPDCMWHQFIWTLG